MVLGIFVGNNTNRIPLFRWELFSQAALWTPTPHWLMLRARTLPSLSMWVLDKPSGCYSYERTADFASRRFCCEAPERRSLAEETITKFHVWSISTVRCTLTCSIWTMSLRLISIDFELLNAIHLLSLRQKFEIIHSLNSRNHYHRRAPKYILGISKLQSLDAWYLVRQWVYIIIEDGLPMTNKLALNDLFGTALV